jgi:PAS domain S-box-containing protein
MPNFSAEPPATGEFNDSSPVAGFVFDRYGIIRNINASAASLVGRQQRELLHRSFIPYIRPDHRDTFLAHIWRVQEGRSPQVCRVVLRTSSNAEMVVGINSVERRNGHGSIDILSYATTVT